MYIYNIHTCNYIISIDIENNDMNQHLFLIRKLEQEIFPLPDEGHQQQQLLVFQQLIWNTKYFPSKIEFVLSFKLFYQCILIVHMVFIVISINSHNVLQSNSPTLLSPLPPNTLKNTFNNYYDYCFHTCILSIF